MTKEEVHQIIEKLADGEYEVHCLCTCFVCEVCEGHQSMKEVRIGDVLEVIKVEIKGDFFRGREMYLLNLWLPFGFSKSLQEIIEDSGWEDCWCGELNGSHSRNCVKKRASSVALKSSSAKALFEFLKTIV